MMMMMMIDDDDDDDDFYCRFLALHYRFTGSTT